MIRKHPTWLLPVLVILIPVAGPIGADPDDPAAEEGRPDLSPTRVARLVERLGGEDPEAVREAERTLRALGEPVLPLLGEARRRAEHPLSWRLDRTADLIHTDRLCAILVGEDPDLARRVVWDLRELGFTPVSILRKMYHNAPNDVIRERVAMVLDGIRLEWKGTPELRYEGEQVVVRVTGETNLPRGAEVTAVLHALFPDSSGEWHDPYLLSGEGSVGEGRFEVAFDPIRLVPGDYRIELKVDTDYQPDAIRDLLVYDETEEGNVWLVTGDEPRTRVGFRFGTDSMYRTEQIHGADRVEWALAEIDRLFAELRAAAAPPEGLPPPAGGLAEDLRHWAAALGSPVPATRWGAQDLLRAVPSEPRAAALADATSAGAFALLWARETERVFDTSFASSDLNLRLLLGQARWRAAQRYIRTNGEIAQRILELRRLGPTVWGEAYPDEEAFRIEPRRAEEAPPQPEPTLDGWAEAFGKTLETYRAERLQDLVHRIDRIRRQVDRERLRGATAQWEARIPTWTGDVQDAVLAAVRTATPGREAPPVARRIAEGFDADGVRALARDLRTLWDAAQGTDEAYADAKHRYLERYREVQVPVSGQTTGEGIRLDMASKTIEIDGWFGGPSDWIEFFACTSAGRMYESVLGLDCRPDVLHTYLLILGLHEGVPPHMADEENPMGGLVDVSVRWEEDGRPREVRAEDLILEVRGEETAPMPRRPWVFLGSEFFRDVNPATGERVEVYAANLNGNIISTFYDPTAILHTTSVRGFEGEGTVHVVNREILPEAGTPMQVILRPTPPEEAARFREQFREERERGRGLPPPEEDLERGRAPEGGGR